MGGINLRHTHWVPQAKGHRFDRKWTWNPDKSTNSKFFQYVAAEEIAGSFGSFHEAMPVTMTPVPNGECHADDSPDVKEPADGLGDVRPFVHRRVWGLSALRSLISCKRSSRRWNEEKSLLQKRKKRMEEESEQLRPRICLLASLVCSCTALFFHCSLACWCYGCVWTPKI